jgi:rhamnose transport system permease protein
MSRYRRELSVLAAWAVLLAVIAVAAPATESGGFFGGNEVRNNLVKSAPVLVAVVGMTVVILTRQIDISIGSQMSVCGVAAGLLARDGAPVALAAAGAIAAGAFMGAANGALVAGLRLPSIVVTLATMVILREGLRWGREGEFVRDLPGGFQWFGLGSETGPWAVVGVAVAVLLAFAWGLRNLAAGRAVYATGSDEEAARLAGIRPARVTFGAFVLIGGLAGLAGLLNAVRFSSVDPNAGAGEELRVIAAVVVGGVAISGGRGSVVGAAAGVLLLGTVSPALVFLRLDAQWEKAVQGAIILLAVASDALDRRGR